MWNRWYIAKKLKKNQDNHDERCLFHRAWWLAIAVNEWSQWSSSIDGWSCLVYPNFPCVYGNQSLALGIQFLSRGFYHLCCRFVVMIGPWVSSSCGNGSIVSPTMRTGAVAMAAAKVRVSGRPESDGRFLKQLCICGIKLKEVSFTTHVKRPKMSKGLPAKAKQKPPLGLFGCVVIALFKATRLILNQVSSSQLWWCSGASLTLEFVRREKNNLPSEVASAGSTVVPFGCCQYHEKPVWFMLDGWWVTSLDTWLVTLLVNWSEFGASEQPSTSKFTGWSCPNSIFRFHASLIDVLEVLALALGPFFGSHLNAFTPGCYHTSVMFGQGIEATKPHYQLYIRHFPELRQKVATGMATGMVKSSCKVFTIGNSSWNMQGGHISKRPPAEQVPKSRPWDASASSEHAEVMWDEPSKSYFFHNQAGLQRRPRASNWVCNGQRSSTHENHQQNTQRKSTQR